jgi:PAS domain S-box-containing protein
MAPDATMVVDSSGRIRLANHLAEELFGYCVEEMLGQPVEMLVPERSRAVHQQHRADYMAAPHVRPMGASLPLSGRRRDGTEFPLEASLGPLEEGGEPLVIVSVRDITERKRLEHVLAERLTQLEAVMEAVPGALGVYDTTGRVILANAKFQAHSPPGVTVAERVHQVGGVFDEHGVPLKEAEWPPTRALQGEVLSGSDAVELAVHLPHEELIYSRITAAPLRDHAGNIIGAVSLNQDITERKRLEREREEARAEAEQQAGQLTAVFEAMADGVVVFDAEGRLVRENAAYRSLLGIDTAPANFAELPLPERLALFAARDEHGRPLRLDEGPLPRALRGEVLSGAETMDLRSRTFDGREVELNVSAAPMWDKDGHLSGVVAIFRDQTEQKRLAREREEARAHELALEDIARHMDEFLATASHDLRTPMTVVKSRIQIAIRRLARLQENAAADTDALRSDAELEALHDSLLAANQSADRLTRLVAVLFDVSRARSGTLELELAPCDLAALVREQVAAQQAAISERRIELEVAADVAVVEADPDRLSQVLTNYLSNALKYSPADQPVTVRLTVVENQAVVSVSDQGPGLPLEERSRIWEWFHRVPGIEVQYESGESSGNLGLGLHICKQLVELHPGGCVGVESVLGEGSTFWFRLPLAS